MLPIRPSLTRAIGIGLAAGLAVAAPAPADVEGAKLPSTLSKPRVYVLPLEGQMGTDIAMPLASKAIEDIRKEKPDIIIYKLNSADINKVYHLNDDDPVDFGISSLEAVEEYRDIVKRMHEDLAEIPQVMWVEDSVGFGSLVALGWPNLYMKSDARLWGLSRVAQMAAGWDDADVKQKMLAAITGIGKGVLQQGGYTVTLGDAMMMNEKKLSVNFKGRNVEWLADTSGVWVVDGSDNGTANFDASLAEDVLLSDGTADSLDDLMFLLGYREYQEVKSGAAVAKQYRDGWRRSFENAKEALEDFTRVDEGGEKGLARQKMLLEKVLQSIKQSVSVERALSRFRLPNGEMFGVNRLELEVQIENLKKEIQRAKEAGRNGGGNGGGGSGRGLGGGGVGGGRRGG